MVASITSCKKNHDDDNANLPDQIKKFVPQNVIDSFKHAGFTINEGKNPPLMNGIYNFKPDLCVYDNSIYDQAGELFDDYRIRFRDQDNSNFSIATDYKSLAGGDAGNGSGSFISGDGNTFTVFIDAQGQESGITYKAVICFSGEKTSTGIKNLQLGTYLKEKGNDPNDELVDPGTTRAFNDNDKISETNATYRSMTSLKGIFRSN